MEPTTQEAPKKALLKLGIPATLITGMAIGALFSPIGVASAQEADPATDETSESEESTDGEARAERKAERKAAIAAIAGVTVEELETAREGGSTLAEIAEANGVERDELVAGLVELAEERVDQAVSNGKIDEEKAAEIKEGLTEKIENRVDGVSNGDGEGRRGKGHRKYRAGGASVNSSSADSTTTVS